VIVKIFAHLGLLTPPLLSPPHAESIYSKRSDPQGKTDSAIGPTIHLGRHSRKRSNCVDISHLGPMQGPKTPRNSTILTKQSCD
jgi:hypothetical protein